jgi:SAM-dependent methyltransferase
MSNVDQIYDSRFDVHARERKMAAWAQIVGYLHRFIVPNQPVLDVGCDEGYFIRFVKAPERWGTDIRDMRASLPDDIRFVASDGLALRSVLPTDHFGTVFMSNYLEHLRSREAVIEQLQVSFDLLRPGGRVIVLQPNIRYTGQAYWDFIDHHVALTERSLVEAGELSGFRTVHLIKRFLPYTTKGKLPVDPRLVQLYLKVPLAWRVLGQQTLYVGERPA